MSSDRVYGAAGQKKLCSITWAEKQEKLQPLEKCFFLTSPFMELPCCPWYDQNQPIQLSRSGVRGMFAFHFYEKRVYQI